MSGTPTGRPPLLAETYPTEGVTVTSNDPRIQPTGRTPAPLPGDPMCWDCGQGWPGLDTGVLGNGSRICVNCQCPTNREVLPTVTPDGPGTSLPSREASEDAKESEWTPEPATVEDWAKWHYAVVAKQDALIESLRADLAAALKREAILNDERIELHRLRESAAELALQRDREKDAALKREGEAREELEKARYMADILTAERDAARGERTALEHELSLMLRAKLAKERERDTAHRDAREARERATRLEGALESVQSWFIHQRTAGIRSQDVGRANLCEQALALLDRALAPVPTAEAKETT